MELIRFDVNHKQKVLAFGKYKGQQLPFMIKQKPYYIKWCLENVKGFELTKEERTDLAISLGKVKSSYRDYCPSGEARCDEWESWAWGGAVSPWGADFM